MANVRTGEILLTIAVIFPVAFGIMWSNRSRDDGPESTHAAAESRTSMQAQEIGKSRVTQSLRPPAAGGINPLQAPPPPAQAATAMATSAAPSVETPDAAQPPKAPIEYVADSSVETDGAGNFLGIRVMPASDSDNAFFRSGLNRGDIVVAVNYEPLDAQHGEALWSQVGAGTVVTVKRWGGKSQNITLNLP